MKKIIIVLAAMIAISAGLANAEVVYTRGTDARVKMYTLGLTGTATLSSAVTTNNRVLGVTYSDSAAGNVGVFDSDSASNLAQARVITDVYVAAGTVQTVMFPLPRDLSLGLVVDMSTATGTVTVYYE